MNSISLVGRAGADPKSRTLDGGQTVATFSIAVKPPKKDADPDWFQLEVWGRTAEVVVDYVRKGSLVGVVGALRIDRWDDRQTGEKRSRVFVRVDKLSLLGSRSDAAGPGAETRPAAEDQDPTPF